VLGTVADSVLTAILEQQVRSSFNFSRRAFTAEVTRRLTRAISTSGNYQIERFELFDEKINATDKLLIDRIFPEVRLSSFSTSVIRNTRDDAIDPSRGENLNGYIQVAARAIGSEVGLAKLFMTGQVFRTLPRARGTVLATSARLGMAVGFPRSVVSTGLDGQSIESVVKDLPASARFFAGGDTTVRGFALDQLGTPGRSTGWFNRQERGRHPDTGCAYRIGTCSLSGSSTQGTCSPPIESIWGS
jgi:outer membrane protein assembly factor BamA